jgi:hypothetical protein
MRELMFLILLGVEYGRLGVYSRAADIRAAPGFAACGHDPGDEALEDMLRHAIAIRLRRNRLRA